MHLHAVGCRIWSGVVICVVAAVLLLGTGPATGAPDRAHVVSHTAPDAYQPADLAGCHAVGACHPISTAAPLEPAPFAPVRSGLSRPARSDIRRGIANGFDTPPPRA